MSVNLVNVDRETPLLLPVDMREWVAEDDLVHFVIESVEALGVRVEVNERGTGSAQYPPRMLLGLLIYGYAQGVCSSRRLEQATYRDVAVRYLCGDTHPDHDTIATFRRKNLKLVKESFVRVLELAAEVGLVQVGTIAVDGTKLAANASKRRSVRQEELSRLSLEVEQKLAQAERYDRKGPEEGTRLPRNLRGSRERRERLQAAAEVLAARNAEPRRKEEAQVNTTDPDSNLQPPSSPGGGFTQGYNAQVAIDPQSRMVVATHVSGATNDSRHLGPTLKAIPTQLGSVQTVVADAGYDSVEQIAEVEKQSGATVYCPPRQHLNLPSGNREYGWRRGRRAARLARHALVNTERGKALMRLRRTTVEPLFGQIKSVLGFRRFHLRGLEGVRGEWTLVTLAYNMRRLWRLGVTLSPAN
jgi:transposase